MQGLVTQTKTFKREKFETTVSRPKDTDSNRFVQWLIFKPQLHAVEPFRMNEATRILNTARGETQPSSGSSSGSSS
jgi:hypothetical protein